MVSGATLTILFTDAVASTELRARLGDVDFDAVQLAHLDALRGCVARHGGREVKSIGDGLMVAFGGAADAVACAVAMQQTIHAGLKAQPEGMSLRVGLALGDVTVDDAGDCHGMAVVEAARLCARADPEQVLVTETVRVVAGTRVGHSFTSLGTVELKGVPDPVPVVEVQWTPLELPALAPLPPAVAITEAWPFAGRSPELDRLRSLLAEAAAGSRRTVLIGGEPGIGKSRLARELAVAAHREGAVVLFGRCEEDLAVAFQPFAEALAHHLLHADEATRDRVLSLWSGSLQRLVPHLAGPPVQGDASVEQWMLLEAIVDWLALVSAEHPVVLVLDDVHWAARPTLLALLHLGRAERLTGVLTLCTYRDTEVDRAHPLSEALADLRREPTVERMRIRGLGAEEVLDFVERSGTDAPSAWAAAIGDHTQGNPFFLGEVLLHLSESGALGEATTDLSNIGVPEGVRDVVGRRLSRLSTTAGTLLTVAAVVGPEFAVDVVAEVAETPIGKAVDAFDQAMATGLIVETTEAGRLAFVHALVRQTLELELSTLRRVQLHRSIGFALEARWADDPGEMAVDLAYHFREAAASGADERRRAARYTRIVGEQAMHRLAYGEAGDCFALAADLRPRDTPADRIERDELLALLMTCRGQENSFGAAIAAALARCEDALAHGDDLALVTTTTAMAVYHIGRQFDLDELAMIDAALAIDLDDVSVAGRRVLNLEGDWQPAETIDLEEWRLLGLMVCSVFGLTLGPRATSVLPAGWPTMYASRFDGEPSNDFDDVNGRGFAAVTLIGVPGARRQLELALQSMQSGRRQGRSRRIGPGPEWPALAALARLGRLDELRHFAEASREMGDRSHSAVLSVVARMAIVMEQLVRGRLDEAASGLDVLRAIAPREPQALFGLTLLTIALSLARGRNVDAAADVEALLELRPSFTFVRGAVAGGVGDIDMCQSVLADWRAEGRHVPENVNRSIKLWALTEAAFAAHDEDAAATLSELLAPYDGELLLAVSNFLPASAAFCLGMCAQTMGDLDLARSHYEDALAFEMQIGAETLATRTRERISLICAR